MSCCLFKKIRTLFQKTRGEHQAKKVSNGPRQNKNGSDHSQNHRGTLPTGPNLPERPQQNNQGGSDVLSSVGCSVFCHSHNTVAPGSCLRSSQQKLKTNCLCFRKGDSPPCVYERSSCRATRDSETRSSCRHAGPPPPLRQLLPTTLETFQKRFL